MLWNVAERKFYTIRRHPQGAKDVAFSPEGDWIATTEGDRMTRIWETRTGQTLATLPGSGDVDQVVWSPDGHYLAATTNWDRTVLLYQITGRHDVQKRLTSRKIGIGSVTPHPRLEQFTTLAYEELTSWDVSAPRPQGRQVGDRAGLGCRSDLQPRRIASGDEQLEWSQPQNPGPGRRHGQDPVPDLPAGHRQSTGL